MSDGQFISDTIESVLVGMAESLRDAQEALTQSAPLDQYGRPLPQYHIPHLDFEIGFELESETKAGGGMRLFFKPVTTQSSRDVTTKLTGRFVSVPAGEGLPLPVLNAQSTALSTTEHDLAVRVTNSAGEVLQGVAVEINFDERQSEALSLASGESEPRLGNGVILQSAVPMTDENGWAVTRVTLGNNVSRSAQIVLTAEVGSEQTLIVLSKADA